MARVTGAWVAVHRGRNGVAGCAEAAADLMRATGLPIRYVGRGERVSLARALARRPAVLVHPGGGELEEAWHEVGRDREAVRAYVRAGGRYLGLCLGGYLAGRTPGYGLLPGDTDQLVCRPASPLRHTGEAVVAVTWGGRVRQLYVQDPPVFLLDAVPTGASRPTVVARYSQGDPAVVSGSFGEGRVVVCGPHPEATPDWFTDAGLPQVPPVGDLATDLLGHLGLRIPCRV